MCTGFYDYRSCSGNFHLPARLFHLFLQTAAAWFIGDPQVSSLPECHAQMHEASYLGGGYIDDPPLQLNIPSKTIY